MSLAQDIKKEHEQVETVEQVISAFENIASTRIKKIKDRTISSKEFFARLWHVYSHLRRVSTSDASRSKDTKTHTKDRNAVVVVTSRGKLSGDIDHQIIEAVLSEIDPNSIDIISIGSHGSSLLKERGVPPVKVFQAPEQEDYFVDLSTISDFIKQYPKTTVYYETYVSLAVQEVKKIELLYAVQELSREEKTAKEEPLIYPKSYIFEPSYQEVIEYMEAIMMKIALSQTLMESSLAQQASRFKAMHLASDRTQDIKDELNLKYHRAKRAEKDTRAKETIYSMLMEEE